MDDPRLTPARPEVAAKYLEGKVKAARFVAGEEFCVEPVAGADWPAVCPARYTANAGSVAIAAKAIFRRLFMVLRPNFLRFPAAPVG